MYAIQIKRELETEKKKRKKRKIYPKRDCCPSKGTKILSFYIIKIE